ncbi:isoaspartyl peptidase/L-asparaginase family protein [Methylocystis heyeri]|uniref:Isoaspartyl peptidase n=1 Tax=Methylocystis heyeri TaxID=391905 RepID=A0A6B8KJD8_9HYPH|nr:isoaspartyl peptidase/L-asparaginase family protein [Methylocystis heyeri]QGM47171.1 isoaspartyl peptidase/L-asparaginase [Methylocystis heyeri]
MNDFSLTIHGGAGALLPSDGYAESLRRIVDSGARLLASGGSALDAVSHCVALLEDDPLYNAGRGAVLDAEGEVRLDASIMDGRNLAAGAVAGVRGVKNPVLLARAVMERTPHVLLIGTGAENFGRAQGALFERPEYFLTERRVRELAAIKRRGADDAGTPMGTVGAVARDRWGDLAAATSTGGLAGQLGGRVGDSPIIGAGAVADNASCAVSCTGAGEHFIKTSLARMAAFNIEFRNMQALDAARETLRYLVDRIGGVGGFILVDRHGRCAQAHSTPGMLFAKIENGEIVVRMKSE